MLSMNLKKTKAIKLYHLERMKRKVKKKLRKIMVAQRACLN